MTTLRWEKLFSEERIRKGTAKNNEGLIVRNEFEADYDRIVGSSSVRRLQDKAQVFPLQKNDVVRTRLTHSMEVSAIARSLGTAVGKHLEKKNKFTREDTEKLAALLQTAGLIHDLGNPPFGHYGEQVIQNWIKSKVNDSLVFLDEQEKMDFLKFDGNVQNLRIVTKLQTMNDQYGANFTLGTLATIMKYPYKSTEIPKGKKKFGYFKSEEFLVKKIREKTGLKEGIRHPATFLLEAADDIVYICDDIEDGVKKGYINWENVFKKLYDKYITKSEYVHIFEKIEKSKPDCNMDIEEQILAKVRVFRNTIQSFFFEKAISNFLKNYDNIMCGLYNEELLGNENEFVEDLKKITSIHCFSCKEVLALEVAGDRVLKELLEIFYNALINAKNDDVEEAKTYSGKIYHIISSNYKYIALYDYEKNTQRKYEELTVYEKIHLIVDFVSGMTDSYAVNLYKELTGISLPE